jgi:peptide deformylase
MAILEILTFPDQLLRRKCVEVEAVTDEIRQLLDDMVETMYDAPGIGLAASQVGSDLRLVVIDVGEDDDPDVPQGLLKLVNPKIEIVETSPKVVTEEGCLSVPNVHEEVTRPSEVRLKALNENGEPIEIDTSGLLAVCLQHEIDHLDGILFIDHLSRLKQEIIKNRLRNLKQSQQS